MNFTEFYTEQLAALISKKTNANSLFVFIGDCISVSLDITNIKYLDASTFHSTSGELVFSTEWADNMFDVIRSAKEPLLLSFAQYSYILLNYGNTRFKDRVIFIKDNLRDEFPLNNVDYIITHEEDEKDVLPIYQTEQGEHNGKFYYTPAIPDQNTVKYFELFDANCESELENCQNVDGFVEIHEQNVLDVLNIHDFTCNQKLYIKDDQFSNDHILRKLNWVLKHFSSSIYVYTPNSSSERDYAVSDEVVQLYKKYWNSSSSSGFRTLKVYKDPSIDKSIIDISQGYIVQMIIEQYKNAKNNAIPKDVFLTASTGAGKSLLFQLPAFYISSRGDITIIISPLIALMHDQVDKIKTERGFAKVGYLNSTLGYRDKDKIINDCKNGQIDVLYMSPELFTSKKITEFIGDRNIGLIVIDEAHLITSWGKDFRVDYWHLGEHIKKRVKNDHNMRFPIVAVTATAILGGEFDTVHETIASLKMNCTNETIFIGKIAREDITFAITHSKNGVNKVNQTAEFIVEANNRQLKTLVYAPFASHVDKIHNSNITIGTNTYNLRNTTLRYTGKIDPDSKRYSENYFKSNSDKVMLCTKAFGMGIDIPDIQIVYHHAPSGLMSDYIQEVGRAARNPMLKGVAMVNYTDNNADLNFNNTLRTLNRISNNNLKLVLNKILKMYDIKKSRNFLMSVSDFAHIFEKDEDDQTIGLMVKRALMFIEKDYKQKLPYSPVIARTKPSLSKSYAIMDVLTYDRFKAIYKGTFEFITQNDNGIVLLLDLNSVYERVRYSNTFESLKYKFYQNAFFQDSDRGGLRVEAAVKIEFINNNARSTIIRILDIIHEFLSKTNGKEFEKKDLANDLAKEFSQYSEDIAQAYLSTFSETLYSSGSAQRNDIDPRGDCANRKYRYNSEFNFIQTLNGLKTIINKEFTENNFIVYPKHGDFNKYLFLGQILEIIDKGMYSVEFGEEPMLSIRVNSSEMLRNLKNYHNKVLQKYEDSLDNSDRIMEHFFSRELSNSERWGFVEDMFLGKDKNFLFQTYYGEVGGYEDIWDKVDVQNNACTDAQSVEPLSLPSRHKKYFSRDKLTFVVNNDYCTKSVASWMKDNPEILLDYMKKGYKFDYDDVIKPFYSKLRIYHQTLYKQCLGLKMAYIDVGNRHILASILYQEDPCKFYDIWKKDESVDLTKKEKIDLFLKVQKSGKRLLKSHKEWLDKGFKK